MKTKILFIMSSLRNGGAERSLVNLLQLFDYQKYEVDLLLFQEEGIFLEQLPNEVHILHDCDILHLLYAKGNNRIKGIKHPLLTFDHYWGTFWARKKTKSMYASRQYRWEHYYKDRIPSIKTKKYDVAISYLHGEQLYYLVDKVDAKRKIAWIHTDYSKLNALEEHDLKYMRQVDSVVSISNICVETLCKTFPSIKEKFCMLPNLTSSSSIKYLAEKEYPKEYGGDEFKIVSVGRLIHLKGFDMAVDAASILKENGLKFSWFILGDGELKTELNMQIKNKNVDDCVFLLGATDNPYKYMDGADILVQTSRYEGKSVVLDEAKILGKPIVVTNYDTVKDQVNDNEGVIVNMSSEAIAAGIMKIIPRIDEIHTYLNAHEYGNQDEIYKYYQLIDNV